MSMTIPRTARGGVAQPAGSKPSAGERGMNSTQEATPRPQPGPVAQRKSARVTCERSEVRPLPGPFPCLSLPALRCGGTISRHAGPFPSGRVVRLAAVNRPTWVRLLPRELRVPIAFHIVGRRRARRWLERVEPRGIPTACRLRARQSGSVTQLAECPILDREVAGSMPAGPIVIAPVRSVVCARFEGVTAELRAR